jgi:3-deoxy-D-manno-octulosonate 8-phosphate phosphatase (KDO 8-P phosphatase)
MPEQKLQQIRLLLLDVDGVLTSGRILYTAGGEEAKSFDVKDGLGIRMVKAAGVRVGLISGRKSAAVERRAAELNIDYCHTGVKDKKALLASILEQAECSPAQAAFVGDDIVDLAIMKAVGLAVAVADAHETVKQHADLVTRRPGGRGAVREICERILVAKGLWETTIARWL